MDTGQIGKIPLWFSMRRRSNLSFYSLWILAVFSDPIRCASVSDNVYQQLGLVTPVTVMNATDISTASDSTATTFSSGVGYSSSLPDSPFPAFEVSTSSESGASWSSAVSSATAVSESSTESVMVSSAPASPQYSAITSFSSVPPTNSATNPASSASPAGAQTTVSSPAPMTGSAGGVSAAIGPNTSSSDGVTVYTLAPTPTVYAFVSTITVSPRSASDDTPCTMSLSDVSPTWTVTTNVRTTFYVTESITLPGPSPVTSQSSLDSGTTIDRFTLDPLSTGGPPSTESSTIIPSAPPLSFESSVEVSESPSATNPKLYDSTSSTSSVVTSTVTVLTSAPAVSTSTSSSTMTTTTSYPSVSTVPPVLTSSFTSSLTTTYNYAPFFSGVSSYFSAHPNSTPAASPSAPATATASPVLTSNPTSNQTSTYNYVSFFNSLLSYFSEHPNSISAASPSNLATVTATATATDGTSSPSHPTPGPGQSTPSPKPTGTGPLPTIFLSLPSGVYLSTEHNGLVNSYAGTVSANTTRLLSVLGPVTTTCIPTKTVTNYDSKGHPTRTFLQCGPGIGPMATPVMTVPQNVSDTRTNTTSLHSEDPTGSEARSGNTTAAAASGTSHTMIARGVESATPPQEHTTYPSSTPQQANDPPSTGSDPLLLLRRHPHALARRNQVHPLPDPNTDTDADADADAGLLMVMPIDTSASRAFNGLPTPRPRPIAKRPNTTFATVVTTTTTMPPELRLSARPRSAGESGSMP